MDRQGELPITAELYQAQNTYARLTPVVTPELLVYHVQILTLEACVDEFMRYRVQPDRRQLDSLVHRPAVYKLVRLQKVDEAQRKLHFGRGIEMHYCADHKWRVEGDDNPLNFLMVPVVTPCELPLRTYHPEPRPPVLNAPLMGMPTHPTVVQGVAPDLSDDLTLPQETADAELAAALARVHQSTYTAPAGGEGSDTDSDTLPEELALFTRRPPPGSFAGGRLRPPS